MIFGQSAGAQSVVAHLSSSASKGLFSSAISQSSLLGVSFVTRHVNSMHITPAVANITNCTSSSEAEMIVCLRALPAETFVTPHVISFLEQTAATTYKAFDGLNEGLAVAEPYLPVTAASGGAPGIIDDQFQYLLGNDSIPNRVPLMVGQMRNEAGLFIPLSPSFKDPLPTSQKEYAGVLKSGQVVPNDTAEAILKSGLVRLTILSLNTPSNDAA
jgi:acetylcholinesterase